MGKKRKRGYRNPNQIQSDRGNVWYDHYYQYLTSLAYQLFEWKGLPESVDPRYLEMTLHLYGFIGFWKDPKKGFIATQGAPSGKIDHYFLPKYFHARSPVYQETFKLFNYPDMLPDDPVQEKMGVIIWNNDYHFSTLPSIKMFAQDLAELKEVIYVNQNAQKTPILITATDTTKFSIQQVYNQIEGNAPAIFAHESFDPNSLAVHKTDAPYVVDKLNTQKNAVWNEIMTFLGIKNANLEKRERMITAEADSNDEQIQASANIWLKSRQEACKRINMLYPELNVSCELRNDIVKEFESNIQKPDDNTINNKGGESDNG